MTKQEWKALCQHSSGSLESLEAAKWGSWWSAQHQMFSGGWGGLRLQPCSRRTPAGRFSCKKRVCEAIAASSISELLNGFWCLGRGNEEQVFGSNRKWSVNLPIPRIIYGFLATFHTTSDFTTPLNFAEVCLDERQQLFFAYDGSKGCVTGLENTKWRHIWMTFKICVERFHFHWKPDAGHASSSLLQRRGHILIARQRNHNI